MSRKSNNKSNEDNKNNYDFDLKDDFEDSFDDEKIDPKTVDKIIDAWSTLREEFKLLQLKERKFKRILNQFLDQTSKADVDYIALDGSTHRLIRKIQERRYLYRKDVPDPIFNKYSKSKLVPFIYIRKKPETIKI